MPTEEEVMIVNTEKKESEERFNSIN